MRKCSCMNFLISSQKTKCTGSSRFVHANCIVDLFCALTVVRIDCCLLQLLKPMMLRRLKEDVEKSIAAKEETIIEVYCVWLLHSTYIFPVVVIVFNK